MNEFAEKANKWRNKLKQIGGWDNELVLVPAGAVRLIIVDLENAAQEIVALHASKRSTSENSK